MKWDLRKRSWAESPTSTAFLRFRSLRWKNNRNRSPFQRLYTKSNCWSLHRSYSGETIMVNSHNFGRIIPAMKSWPRLWILFAQIKQFFKIPQRRPRSMCGCSFFNVIDRLNHLMNISSSVGHLAGWTSQKWQPFRCPQKPAEKPGISDIWMCDMVEECMMPHNRSSSCDYDYVRLCLTSCMKGQEIFAMSANVRVRPSLCESAQKTWISQFSVGHLHLLFMKRTPYATTLMRKEAQQKAAASSNSKEDSKHTSIRITHVVRAQLANFNSKEVNTFHQCPFQPNIKPA